MGLLKNIVEIHFKFLYQFGYKILEKTPNNVMSFQGKNNRLDVEFSETDYEITCQFIDNENQTFSLQDALSYVFIFEYKGMYQVSSKTEIENGVIYLSKAIKLLFEKINRHSPYLSITLPKYYQYYL